MQLHLPTPQTAAGEFARQGLSAAETIKRTSDALTLSRLSGLDFAASVQAMTAALNSFGKEALTTTEIVDRMAAVDAAFAVSSADLAEAIRRVASSADSANVSLNETIAVVTAAQQITARGGAKIGNAFKTIFTRLQRPRVLDQLRQIGVETKNAAGSTLPLMQVLQNLANKYDLLTESQRSYISEQIGSVYQINILKATMKDLGGEMSLYSRALETAENSMGSSERRTNELNTTLSSKLVRSLNSAKQAAAALGKTVIAPTIGGVADVGTKLFDGISKGAEKGESKMGRVAQGALKGLGAVLQGPGLQALVSLGIKLFGNLTKFIVESGSEMGNFGQEAKNVASIQESILAHLKENPEVLRDITNGTLSVEDAHSKIIDRIKDETTLLQQQLKISREIAVSLASSGVKTTSTSVEGTPEQGLPESVKRNPLTLSRGYIPNVAAAERAGARAGGYEPGAVIKGPDLKSSGGPARGDYVMNAAETISTVRGKTWINPPENSRAGRDHLRRSKLDTGVNPYQLSEGFVPNFADYILQGADGSEITRLQKKRESLIELQKQQAQHPGSHIFSSADDGLTDEPILSKGFIPNFAKYQIGQKIGEGRGEDGRHLAVRDQNMGIHYDPTATFHADLVKKSNLMGKTMDGGWLFPDGRYEKIPGHDGSGLQSKGFIPNFETEGFERKFKGHFADPKNLADQFFINVGAGQPRTDKAKEVVANIGRASIEDLGNGQTRVSILSLKKGSEGQTAASFAFSNANIDDIRSYNINSIEGNGIIDEEDAVQYVKELAGFNANRGETISITSPNGFFNNQFLGIGRESIAFEGPETDGHLTAIKEPLRKVYPNIKIDPVTGEEVLQHQATPGAAKKFKTRHGFLTALQDEEYDILGENVRFPKRLGAEDGRYLEENVYAEGGEDFLQMYNSAVAQGKGKETLGAIQFYLEQIQQEGYKNLGLQGGMGGAAFPNLDPRSSTIAAHPQPEKGMIKKMTDNVLVSSLQDVENLQNIISGPAGSALASYSDGFETIRKAQLEFKAIPEADEETKNKALEEIKKLEEAQRAATTNIATQFPELNDINRIVLDFETSLSEDFTHAPNYAGGEGLSNKLNEILDGRKSVAVSQGFIPNFAVKDNSEIVEKLVMLVEGGNVATAQQLFNTLGNGNESLGDDLITGLYARLEGVTTNIAESRGVSELEQVRGGPSIPTMIGVHANMEGNRRSLAALNEKKDNPFYKKNAEQIDLLDRGIRIREALGIRTGSEYLGPGKGHGVTGTGTSNPKFLNKPGEILSGTDLPVPLNPNLVDPDIHHLPPMPGTIDEITAVKYHHKDPHDYPWLGKGVADGFVPNFIPSRRPKKGERFQAAELQKIKTSHKDGSVTLDNADKYKYHEFIDHSTGADSGFKALEDMLAGSGTSNWRSAIQDGSFIKGDAEGSAHSGLDYYRLVGGNPIMWGRVGHPQVNKHNKLLFESFLEQANVAGRAVEEDTHEVNWLGGPFRGTGGYLNKGHVPNFEKLDPYSLSPWKRSPAFRLKDGGIQYDGDSDNHPEALLNLGISSGEVSEQGWADMGEFSPEGAMASRGFVPNFLDPVGMIELQELLAKGGMVASIFYAMTRSILGDDEAYYHDGSVKEKDGIGKRFQDWWRNRSSGSQGKEGDISIPPTGLPDTETKPHESADQQMWGDHFEKIITDFFSRKNKASGFIPNFLETKSKKAGQKSLNLAELLPGAAKLGKQGISAATGGVKDLLNPDKPFKLAENYISGSLSDGYIPNMSDVEVMGNIVDEKAAYTKFFKDYAEGNVQNDAGINLEALDREMTAFGPYLFAGDQEGSMDPQVEAFLEANRQRLHQLGYLSGGFIPNFTDELEDEEDELPPKRNFGQLPASFLDNYLENHRVAAEEEEATRYPKPPKGFSAFGEESSSRGFVPNFNVPMVTTDSPFKAKTGLAFFDSDWIGNRTESNKIVDDITTSSTLPYHVFHGPAGAGKTTLARKIYPESEIIESLEQYQGNLNNDAYRGFAVMSGTSRSERTGEYSDRSKAIFHRASQVTAVAPDDETVMERRINRINEEKARLKKEKDSGVKLTRNDTRNLGALKVTRFAPLSDVGLYQELSDSGVDVKDEYDAIKAREESPEKYGGVPEEIYASVKARLKGNKADGFVPNFVSSEMFGGNPMLRDISTHPNVRNFADWYNTSIHAGTGDRGIAPTGTQEGTWAAISSIYSRITGRQGNLG